MGGKYFAFFSLCFFFSVVVFVFFYPHAKVASYGGDMGGGGQRDEFDVRTKISIFLPRQYETAKNFFFKSLEY